MSFIRVAFDYNVCIMPVLTVFKFPSEPSSCPIFIRISLHIYTLGTMLIQPFSFDRIIIRDMPYGFIDIQIIIVHTLLK